MFEFMIRRVLGDHNLDTVEGRVAALRAAAPVVAGIRDRALNIGYVRNLAGWLGLDPSEVGQAVSAAAKRAGSESKDGGRGSRGRDDVTPAGNAVVSEPAESGPSITQLPTDPNTRLERDALMAVLQLPAEVGIDLATRASQSAFANPSLAVVRDGVASSLAGEEGIAAFNSTGWLDRVIAEVPAPFSMLVKELGVAPIPEKSGRELDAYCQGITLALIDRDLLRQKAELLGRLQRSNAAAEPERYSQLQRELVRVESERRALRDE
jgi:DNA primase